MNVCEFVYHLRRYKMIILCVEHLLFVVSNMTSSIQLTKENSISIAVYQYIHAF